jgi:hypothetical protein
MCQKIFFQYSFNTNKIFQKRFGLVHLLNPKPMSRLLGSGQWAKDLLTVMSTFNGYYLFHLMNVKKEQARGN